MEGQLNQDDSILKVAVKTMKSESMPACAHVWEPPSPSPRPFSYAPKEAEAQKS